MHHQLMEIAPLQQLSQQLFHKGVLLAAWAPTLVSFLFDLLLQDLEASLVPGEEVALLDEEAAAVALALELLVVLDGGLKLKFDARGVARARVARR